MLEQALKSHMEGDLAAAEALYQAILAETPGQPDAIHYLGILYHQLGRSDEALALVRESLRLVPNRSDWHNDLGNMLAEGGASRQAAEAFLNAVELDPLNAGLWNNLGSTQVKLEQYADAETAFGKALEIDPVFSDALVNMGNLLEFLDRKVDAAQLFCRAYILEPTEDKPKSMLGIAYYKLGRIDDAARIYHQWMMEEPDNPVPRHLYASCSGIDVPERASDAYIEATFDKFSENFDVNMELLSYRGHELVLNALSRVAAAEGKFVALDAGCGTGLCGPLLRPYLSRLVGLDISAGMLEGAGRRGAYDELVRMELTAYLDSHSDAFDLIVAADTLIYFGDLGDVFKAMREALKQGGLLIFTVEEGDEDYRINPHGRYSHGRGYLRAALAHQGFEAIAVESGVLRFEFGKAVDCLVVTARAM